MRPGPSHRVPVHAVALVLALLGSLPVGAQTTVWVAPCAGPGTGTVGNPYCKIQTAICAIQGTGGTINVLPGLYRESLRVAANVKIISTDGPAVTTLDATGKPCPTSDFCTIGTEPNCSAVYFPSAAGANSRIEGLRIGFPARGHIVRRRMPGRSGASIPNPGSPPAIESSPDL